MKSWSYKQITEHAERQIRGSLGLAAKAEERDDPDVARCHRYMALGIYASWDSLTMGWQQSADSARLRALAYGESTSNG